MYTTSTLDSEVMRADQRGNDTISDEVFNPIDQSSIDVLLTQAAKIFDEARKKERELLMERIEIGRILIKLKDKVGHGNFMSEFKKWQEDGKINFSLKTAQRAMNYVALKEDGKIDNVSNLSEAEKIRKVEESREKAADKEAERQKAADDECKEPQKELKPAKLTKPQIGLKAKQLVKSALDGCQIYNTETRILLLEELIEILTQELEQCP